jgi:cytochrome c biogenesis factor
MIVAIGVTGSSLGAQRREALMYEGDTLRWAGRQIRYGQLVQREAPGKLIAEAVLHVSRNGDSTTLRPARHLHLLQNEWTTEVAIHSSWRGDFYTILNAGLGDGQVSLTLVDNPLVGWIWMGGFICLAGALAAMWPPRRRRSAANEEQPSPQRAQSSHAVNHSRRAA